MRFFKRKSKREEIDSQGVVYVIAILFVLKIIQLIIESGEWVNFGFMFIVGISGYYVVKFIEKKKKEKPVLLPRQFRNKFLIVPQYLPPKNLNPAEVGLLYNCKVDVSDLTSLIYQWAFEGLISIKSVESKEDKKRVSQIELIKMKEIDETRPFFETEIFNSIFYATHKKIITNSFELRYALILEDLEIHGIRKGWVARSGEEKYMKYIYKLFMALVLFLAYLYVGGLFVEYPRMRILLLTLLISCVLLGGYVDGGKLKLTEKGAKLASYAIGYRNFIKSCDENMIKLYLKEDPFFIDKTLPYATAFGLETEFLNKVTPLAEDRKAKYVNGQKVSPLISVIANIFSASNKKTFDIFYHW